MTSGSSPHWLAAALLTANPNAKILWRGRAGLSQQPPSSCFLLGVKRICIFLVYKGFNCNIHFWQVATDSFIVWVFLDDLEKLVCFTFFDQITCRSSFFSSYFWSICSSILCPLPNWHGVQTCVCLTGWSSPQILPPRTGLGRASVWVRPPCVIYSSVDIMVSHQPATGPVRSLVEGRSMGSICSVASYYLTPAANFQWGGSFSRNVSLLCGQLGVFSWSWSASLGLIVFLSSRLFVSSASMFKDIDAYISLCWLNSHPAH